MVEQIVFTNLVVYLLFQMWQVGVAFKDHFRWQRMLKRKWFTKLDQWYSVGTLLSVVYVVLYQVWV